MSDSVAIAITVAIPPTIGALVAAVVALRKINAMERKVNIIFAWFLRQLEGKTLTADEIKRFFDGGGM